MAKKPKKVPANTQPPKLRIEETSADDILQPPERKQVKARRRMTPERRQRIITRIAIGLILFIVLLGVLTVLQVLPDGQITNYEIRLFAVLFLFLCVFMVLSIYMLRNAVVSNTAFLIKVKDSLFGTGRSMKEMEREVSKNTDAQKYAAHVMENLDRTIKSNVKKEEGQ